MKTDAIVLSKIGLASSAFLFKEISLPELKHDDVYAEVSSDWKEALKHEIKISILNEEKDILPHATDILEKILIEEALSFTKGRRIEAAQILGLGRNTLTRKIQELKIEK
jgi:two-component system nitrogen regulation response regulator GlnG